MNKQRGCNGWVLVLLVCLVLTGCKAVPAREAGFVDSSAMEKLEHLPFHKAWIKEGVDIKEFTEIYIPKVNTSYLLQSEWWQDFNRYGEIRADVEKIADYTKEIFINAFRDDPKKRFASSDNAGSTNFPASLR